MATPGLNPFFGTSASAPHAAAIAALVMSATPTPGLNAVRNAMLSTALDIEGSGVDRDSGNGIVVADAPFGKLNMPDLIAEWLKIKPSCVASEGGCFAKGRLAVANQGPVAAVSSTARVYYSTDFTLDPSGDTLLVLFPVSALPAGAGQINPMKLLLPDVTDTLNGSIYVRVDVTDGVLERNEFNNEAVNSPF